MDSFRADSKLQEIDVGLAVSSHDALTSKISFSIGNKNITPEEVYGWVDFLCGGYKKTENIQSNVNRAYDNRTGDARSCGCCICVHELVRHVKQFERTSGSYYSVRTSKANSSGDKKFIKYRCHRKDFARRPNDGRLRRLLDHTQCEAYFNVGRLGNSFRITRFNMLHNHDFLGAEASRWFTRNRRLLPEELETIRPILECRSRSFNIWFYVRSKFSQYLTNSEVENIRAQHMIGRGNPNKSYFRRLHSRSGDSIQ
ncbi:hypothetical protein CLF_112128 [Clonorchis sinensis]|uniref:FAR1 domain-containing protein n=1 Tax=Clonorchis sinensis TaxID=79923 RepID=H2KT71_CLOSI|nr:hypothetical protein CLF_112128 [Clonorchis sinensis]